LAAYCSVDGIVFLRFGCNTWKPGWSVKVLILLVRLAVNDGLPVSQSVAPSAPALRCSQMFSDRNPLDNVPRKLRDDPTHTGWGYLFFPVNGGMSMGRPTRMKKRANDCDRCSRYGGSKRSRLESVALFRTYCTGNE